MSDSGTISRRGFMFAAVGVSLGGVQACRYLNNATTGPDLEAGHFGTVADGVVDDGPALRRALAATRAAGRGATLRLGSGRYRVGGAPGADYALPVSGAHELRIIGDNATIVVADPALGCLSFSDCERCLLQGVTIDYDPPPFTQTTVTGVDAVGNAFDVEVEPGYPLLDAPFFNFPSGPEAHPATFGAVFDPKTHLLKAGMIDFVVISDAERLGPRLFRVRPLGGLPAGLLPGDVFVYLARAYGHAVACYRSSATTLRDVHVRAANGVAFALASSDAALITGCSVAIEQGSSRLVSTNADGVHAQACRVGPVIEDCTFIAMMDDGLNIYAPPLEVLAVPSDSTIVVTSTVSVRTGDRLEFSDPVSGRVTGVRRVQQASATGPGQLRLHLVGSLRGLPQAAQHAAVPAVFNLSASGEGYQVRDNRYERHRGHAMRLHTGRGIVVGNQIRETSREGILVSNDPDWPEGPHTRDLVVRRNTVVRTGGEAAIRVEGRKLGYQLADTATQRRITIVDNTISNWRGSAIAIGAARNVQLRDNLLLVGGGADADAAETGVLLEQAQGVDIHGLVIRTAVPGLRAAIEIAPTVTEGRAGVRIRGVRVAGVDKVRDLRDPPVTRRSRAAEAAGLAGRVGPTR